MWKTLEALPKCTEEIKMREKVIDLEHRNGGPVCRYVNIPKEEAKALG